MSAPARHLHVLDSDTGEILDTCPACAEKDFIIAGHETTIKGWEVKYGKLKADKEAEARAHALWPVALDVFKFWRVICDHPRAVWGADRFEEARPFLQSKEYGATLDDRIMLCKRAIIGADFDCFKTRRRNGSIKRHDGWDLIFRDKTKFEEFVNKAPRDWRERVQRQSSGHQPGSSTLTQPSGQDARSEREDAA